MTIRYVHLDGSRNIVASVGDFAVPQPGLATDPVDDQSAAFVAYLNPPPTPAQTLAANLANGITVASTGTPAINGTYALDTRTQNDLANIASVCAFTGAFPGGGSTLTYPDITGLPQNQKTFPSVDVFKAFFIAYTNLVFQMETTEATLSAGGQASWPSQQVSIA